METTKSLLAIGMLLFKKAGFTRDEFPFEDDEKNEEWDVVDPDWFDLDKEDAGGPFDYKELDQSGIQASQNLAEECISLIVGYVNRLKSLLRRFLQTSINEVEENSQIVNSIKKLIANEDKLDVILSKNEPMDSLIRIENSMDGIKDFFDDTEVLFDILNYEKGQDHSDFLKTFLSEIRDLTSKFKSMIGAKIREYDRMDIVKKFKIPPEIHNKPIRPRGWANNFSRDNPWNTYTGGLDEEPFFGEE